MLCKTFCQMLSHSILRKYSPSLFIISSYYSYVFHQLRILVQKINNRSSCPELFFKKRYSGKFYKIHKRAPALESNCSVAKRRFTKWTFSSRFFGKFLPVLVFSHRNQEVATKEISLVELVFVYIHASFYHFLKSDFVLKSPQNLKPLHFVCF